MIENVVVLPEALGDVAEAYAWYESRGTGLGDQYLAHIDECFDRIRKHPQLYEQVYQDYHRAIVHRFPYVVFYKLNVDTITVYSVFHSAQDPRKWRKRLP